MYIALFILACAFFALLYFIIKASGTNIDHVKSSTILKKTIRSGDVISRTDLSNTKSAPSEVNTRIALVKTDRLANVETHVVLRCVSKNSIFVTSATAVIEEAIQRVNELSGVFTEKLTPENFTLLSLERIGENGK
jgi:hypothetical protein